MLQTRQDILSRVWPLIVLAIVIVVMLKALTLIPTWLWVAVLVAGSVWVVRSWWPR